MAVEINLREGIMAVEIEVNLRECNGCRNLSQSVRVQWL
jgi:hypothetical protein